MNYIDGSPRDVTLRDLANVDEEYGRDATESVIRDLTEDASEYLTNQVGIPVEAPENVAYDSDIEGLSTWAGYWNSKDDLIAIADQSFFQELEEIEKEVEQIREFSQDIIGGITGTQDDSPMSSGDVFGELEEDSGGDDVLFGAYAGRDVLETNAWNTSAHELWHKEQDESYPNLGGPGDFVTDGLTQAGEEEFYSISQANKEAFAQLVTLALNDELTDRRAREDHLETIESEYDKHYGTGAGNKIREIAEETVRNNSFYGSTDRQLRTIYDAQEEAFNSL